MSDRQAGRAWCYGDDVDTDVIMPGRYLRLQVDEAVKHAMEGIDPDFSTKVRPGDFVVAGRNFGTGSSRELAAQGLKAVGVCAIIAESFARIFYRNAITLGLPALECAEARQICEGDQLDADLDAGTIRNLTQGATYRFPEFPPHLLRLLRAGGLVPYLEEEIRSGRIRPVPPPPAPAAVKGTYRA